MEIRADVIALFLLAALFSGCVFGLFMGYQLGFIRGEIVGNKSASSLKEPISPEYGCPGCPSNYMDFAQDMCSRGGSEEYTVSDGKNTLACSELANV